jgi:hypothetical protein
MIDNCKEKREFDRWILLIDRDAGLVATGRDLLSVVWRMK